MRVILWLSVVVLIGSFLCRPLADPDLWWHIIVGRWIVAHKTVPVIDYWNMFGAGQPWRAYSWSNEVVYALVERWGGDFGLAVLQLVLGCVLALTAQCVFGAIAGCPFFGALLGILTTVACRGHFSLRPQTVVWVLFLLVLLLAEMVRRRGPKGGYLAALICLGSAWANTHLSSIFGVVGLALWLLPERLGRKELSQVALVVGCFVVGTFISPYFGGEWLTFLEKSDHIFNFRLLDEFKPADLTQVPTLCVMFQVVLLAVLGFASHRLPPRGPMALAAVAVLAGALAVKFTPFSSIALGALTAVWFKGISSEERAHGGHNHLLQGLLLLRRHIFSLQAQTIGACAFFFGCIAWVNCVKAARTPVDYAVTPKKAVDFMEAHALSHPVLSEFAAGGYLEYRWSSAEGVPHHLVSIDGRTNVNRKDVWESYVKAFIGREGWRDYFAKVNPQTVIWRQGSPLVPILLEAPEWCRIFVSGQQSTSYVVFVTREEFDRRKGEFSASDCS